MAQPPYPSGQSPAELLNWAQKLVRFLSGASEVGTPSGTIVLKIGEVPQGWLPIQGQLLKRATYPGLFLAVGTGWTAVADPVDSFRLPKPLTVPLMPKSPTDNGMQWIMKV